MDADSAIQILIALGGGGLIGSYLTNRREHYAWLRERRMQTYSALDEVWWQSGRTWHSDDQDERLDVLSDITKAMHQAEFLAPKWLRAELLALFILVEDVLTDKVEFTDEVQEKLGNDYYVLQSHIAEAFGYDHQPIRWFRIKRRFRSVRRPKSS